MKNFKELKESLNEAKKLGSRVMVTKGKDKGKIGVVRQINKGSYGRPGDKAFDLDLEDGGELVVDASATKELPKDKIEEAVKKGTRILLGNEDTPHEVVKIVNAPASPGYYVHAKNLTTNKVVKQYVDNVEDLKLDESLRKDIAKLSGQYKTGSKVKIKNARSYDSLAKSDTLSGTVLGTTKDAVMVAVGTGQYNVSPKDIMESVDLEEEAPTTSTGDVDFTPTKRDKRKKDDVESMYRRAQGTKFIEKMVKLKR